VGGDLVQRGNDLRLRSQHGASLFGSRAFGRWSIGMRRLEIEGDHGVDDHLRSERLFQGLQELPVPRKGYGHNHDVPPLGRFAVGPPANVTAARSRELGAFVARSLLVA
jgi:hypothetical protein